MKTQKKIARRIISGGILALMLIMNVLPVMATDVEGQVPQVGENQSENKPEADVAPPVEEEEPKDEELNSNTPVPDTTSDTLNKVPNQPAENKKVEESQPVLQNATPVTVAIESPDVMKGTFTVVISGIESGITRVLVPTWCAEGQTDIVWYEAGRRDDGTFSVDVDIKNHQYHTGVYQIHVYQEKDGALQGLAATSYDAMKTEIGQLEITKQDSQVYKATLSGAVVPGGIRGLQFAIWSIEKGQDDLQWISVAENHGSYTYNIDISKFKSLGAYNLHVYALNQHGDMVFIQGQSFETAMPKVTSLNAQVTDEQKGVFHVEMTVENPELVREVYFPIWSTANQSDIVWYRLDKNASGIYTLDVNAAAHRYHVGTYQIHAYITDVTGSMGFGGNTSSQLNPNQGSFSISEKAESAKWTASIIGASIPGGMRSVSFAVWSNEKGQDDLIWYPGRPMLNGDYYCDISVGSHKSMGEYQVHVYAQNNSGEMIFLNNGTFTVQEPSVGNVMVSEPINAEGRFTVTLSDVQNGSAIKKF